MVTPLEQVGAAIRIRQEAVLEAGDFAGSIVPNKRICGDCRDKSSAAINSERPKFYLREAPPDPDQCRECGEQPPGETAGLKKLVRLEGEGGKSGGESIRSLFGEQISKIEIRVAMQRWMWRKMCIALRWGKAAAGEYAFVEICRTE